MKIKSDYVNRVAAAKRELIAEGHADEDEIDKQRLHDAACLRVAERHMEELESDFNKEMQLAKTPALANAYGPIARRRIVDTVQQLTTGMAVVRLRVAGHSPREIAEALDISVQSVAAFSAWNTMYKRGK